MENQVQVFIFIEQNVYSEYQTYLLSKDNADIKYQFVDNPNVYKFIDSVHNLPANNPITPSQTASDRVFFTTEEELNRWLVAQNWLPVAERAYEEEGSIREWFSNEYEQYIRLTEMIFDEESRLQLYTEDE